MRKSTLNLVLLAIAAASGCSQKEKAAVDPPPRVRVAAAARQSVRRMVEGDGVLWAHDQTVITSRIQAPVQQFFVNRGDHVSQGQLLAVLENHDLLAVADAARSALEEAESNLRTVKGATVPEAIVRAQTDVDSARNAMEAAKRVLESRQGLFKQGALARRQVDEAQATYAQANSNYLAAQEHARLLESVGRDEQIRTAEAKVAAAHARYRSAQVQVGYSRITSPINGVVRDRPLFAGDVAQPGKPLMTVFDVSRVVARVNIPHSQARQVREGMPATVTVNEIDMGDRKGLVTVVSPSAEPNSTSLQIWIELENPDERLKPGSPVHGVVVTDTVRSATVVPKAAILPAQRDGDWVLVVDAGSIAHRRRAVLGVRDGGNVQVLNGVKPGENVVVAGGLGVEDKDRVNIGPPGVQSEQGEASREATDSGANSN